MTTVVLVLIAGLVGHRWGYWAGRAIESRWRSLERDGQAQEIAQGIMDRTEVERFLRDL